MFGVFYFINSHFMSSNFLLTFILRQVLTWTFLCFNVFMQDQDHMFEMVMLFGMDFLLVILVEGSNYYCIRSKAQLFLRLKVTSMQEKQLSHLMDSMPDRFLISTLAHEARAPKSIYSNKQMNTFFGCDMVKAHGKEAEVQREETNSRI